MNITIFGSGYVGLVTAACFADAGNDVLCVDVDAAKVERLRRGECPIYEPGLEEMLQRNVREGRMRFTTEAAEGVAHGLYQFIAVGTPPNEDGSADMQYVLAVARAIGQHMGEYRVVISKSTVPVGTADQVRASIEAALGERGAQVAFDVVSNPEFLKEGAAVADFNKPDRIVVGVSSERAAELMHALYAPFNRNHDRMIVMDVRSSELTKYAANAMLATKISFMNEMANLAEKLGADIEKVRVGIGSDPRIGFHFIYPGCGYGGSCFPKDVKALVRTAKEVGAALRVLDAVEEANEAQKQRLYEKLKGCLGSVKGKRVALWGLAFKPQTDDMREAPSIPLCEALVAAGAEVVAYDPEARHTAREVLGDAIVYAEDPYRGLEGADALCLVTEWKEFTAPDWERVWALMRDHFVYDGRNLWEPREVGAQGFKYRGIGRR
ncbi:MAG TPA: UDP-glucose/GDP-mannose dehydrogenase family protein [Nevskiaceae bacterium]|nr:UDP-glucose/GDP-mannose dehydrogenase family protein [Nevskiaceae bacterium]